MIRWMVLVSLYVVSGIGFSSNASSLESHMIAIIDAGSSGSRAHFYSYQLDANHSPVNIKEFWSRKISPGLSSITQDQLSIDSYMDILFTEAPAQDMPVYFYATGGMRLLPQKMQHHYYQMVSNWFSNRDSFKLMEAKTITGKEEATYGWLSVNYQMGNFKASKRSLGVLDIGGASVQIAFPVAQGIYSDNDDIVNLKIYGKDYSLFVHSFLGLGQTEFAHQYMDEPSCYSRDFILPSGRKAQGNAQLCSDRTALLIQHVHQVDSITQPLLLNNKVDRWYTIGGLSTIFGTDVFKAVGYKFTAKKMLSEADTQVCQQNWDDVDKNHPKNNYVSNYCMLPSAYHSLIVNGYGIKPNRYIHLLPPGKNSDWTIGTVIKAVSATSINTN